ncbi:hypothetical protein niasHT_024674 [Heterodera trifolii]|uniref:Uncharacterized protein n=1 Tax=Heterodera trifolii TaxID=157864 RepID=A0ABD2K8N0_9BILA
MAVASAGDDSLLEPLVIKQGESLTLSQLVQKIEQLQNRTVRGVLAILRRRTYKMPVGPPNPNGDRFFQSGHLLVEDVPYNVAGKTRNSIHGIIQLHVEYEGIAMLDEVNYHF